MEDEEKYWDEFEKVYVHNVYESISSKIDEFGKISPKGCLAIDDNNGKIVEDGSKENDPTLNSTTTESSTQNRPVLFN